MSLGRAPAEEDLFATTTAFCEKELSENSIYALLHRQGHHLFPDDAFADLFAKVGRPSISPRIVAIVMILARIEGRSDREAVEQFKYDLRWKYAAGGLSFDHAGFAHTVLVDMRERLRRSKSPDRIFEAVQTVCKEVGLVGRKRVFDSTALYDAVATQDTVTLVRSAIRQLLKVADPELALLLRGALRRDDDYTTAGKPVCDWDDKEAREALVDALARDAHAALSVLHGRECNRHVGEAARLLASIVGQDLEESEDGLFRIVHGVAPDRIISTVDPETRHGHKTSANGFDGYKGHVSVDPDSECIVAMDVTPGNVGDGQAAEPLIAEAISKAQEPVAEPNAAPPVEVYGDGSYGTAAIVERLEAAGIEANVKVAEPTSRQGRFTKNDFEIDLDHKTVKCPAGVVVQLKLAKPDSDEGVASFAPHCEACPHQPRCTASKTGRVIRTHPKERILSRSRIRQRQPGWRAKYRATRPKVERKIGHLMRRRHGGRRARVRGIVRVRQDFLLLGAAANLKRLATLSVGRSAGRWTR